MRVKIKRVYDEPAKSDGHRVLVDRIWPRGLKKSEARIDEWLKRIAPSTGLRKWFKHDPRKWEQFKKKYAAELKEHCEEAKKLAHKSRKQNITFLSGAKDTAHNNAVALKEHLDRIAD
ncbi:MAG TPA: DUF488 family protein [Candidatus Udaeobacter sp.]